MPAHTTDRRPWTFYVLAAVFTLFVLFLYGPMACIYILSFQGPNGGLTFPLNGVSVDWFGALFHQQRTGDISGAFGRSIPLAIIVLTLTVVFSLAAGLAFRRRFVGAGLIFYVAIASLIVPGLGAQRRHRPGVPDARHSPALVLLGVGRASQLDTALRTIDHVCGFQPAQPFL